MLKPRKFLSAQVSVISVTLFLELLRLSLWPVFVFAWLCDNAFDFIDRDTHHLQYKPSVSGP